MNTVFSIQSYNAHHPQKKNTQAKFQPHRSYLYMTFTKHTVTATIKKICISSVTTPPFPHTHQQCLHVHVLLQTGMVTSLAPYTMYMTELHSGSPSGYLPLNKPQSISPSPPCAVRSKAKCKIKITGR